jgi:hypothetical protein
MVDYVDRFAELIDQLIAYNIHIDTINCTTRFIDGLKHGRIYQVGFVRLKPTLHFQQETIKYIYPNYSWWWKVKILLPR